MEKDYKLLGGIINIRYATDGDADKLSEEELDLLKEEYKDLKSDLKEMKRVINANSPKEEKPTKSTNVLADDDIPYEVRMKHIIKAYKKDQEKWGKLEVYAKHLEKEVIRLKDIMIANGYTDSGNEQDIKAARVINDLRTENNDLKAKIKDLKAKMKDLKAFVNDPEQRIKDLENKINNVYPLRKYKVSSFKKVIKSQELYIEALQKLLDENNIPYHPKCPINDLEAEGAENIDENAVRDY